jgi:hypothetical protein
MEILSDIVFGVLFIIFTVTLSLGSYVLARWVAGRGPYDRHKEMAGAMVSRIAALHGLILALVFAQEMSAYQRLEAQTAAEASAIADVFNDAARYDPTLLTGLQQDMREYLRVVIDTEWDQLGSGNGLSDAAWATWSTAYERVLDLTPQTPRQVSLRDHLLASLHAISSSRDMRAAEASTSVAHFFWIAALSGVVLIAIGHYIYPPERHNLLLLVMFSAYTGAILFLIFGFSNPYSPPASLQPAPLQSLAGKLLAGSTS